MLVSLISLTSAIDIYAGDSYSFTLNEQYSYYEITGNQTEIDLEVQQNGTIVTILFGKYMKNDTFTITFYNEKDEPIEQEETTSSGGSGSKGICYRGYKTTEWSECNGTQIRNVTKDWKTCHQTFQEKPTEIQDCEIIKLDDEPLIKQEEEKGNWVIRLIKWIWDKIIFWK